MDPLFVVVGGFLGAGKTTTVLEATRRLQAAGKKVAIVTNDQGSGLVDTALARTETDSVAEIPGGCFCCRFDAVEDALARLAADAMPDIVLAEAVGSCTDLAATVVQPMRQRGSRARLGPLTVVVDSRRLLSMSLFRVAPAFPGSVRYLFDKQLAEADVVLVNKVDKVSRAEQDEIFEHLERTFRGIRALPICASTGEGLPRWLELLQETPSAGHRLLELDYEQYAEAEAALAWLNAEGTLRLEQGQAGDWLAGFLAHVQAQTAAAGTEIGHVKAWMAGMGGTARGNTVAADQHPTILTSGELGGAVRIIVNARVATQPALLERWVREAAAATQPPATFERLEAFRPAPPRPQHRVTAQVE
jgi:G3E family GTPase